MTNELKEKLKNINTFIFDVDGVLTDCTLTISDKEITRVFNVKDGYAIRMAAKNGYHIAVISGGREESIATRMRLLGLSDIFLNVGTADKPAVFQQYIDSKNVSPQNVLFIGDDIPDLLLMKKFPVFACCPADAVDEVIQFADYITQKPGGKGAAREVIELVMKAQDKWMKVF